MRALPSVTTEYPSGGGGGVSCDTSDMSNDDDARSFSSSDSPPPNASAPSVSARTARRRRPEASNPPPPRWACRLTASARRSERIAMMRGVRVGRRAARVVARRSRGIGACARSRARDASSSRADARAQTARARYASHAPHARLRRLRGGTQRPRAPGRHRASLDVNGLFRPPEAPRDLAPARSAPRVRPSARRAARGHPRPPLPLLASRRHQKRTPTDGAL
eukprot:31135-Pelagococcus_subviridis.AAC.27